MKLLSKLFLAFSLTAMFAALVSGCSNLDDEQCDVTHIYITQPDGITMTDYPIVNCKNTDTCNIR